MTMLDEECPKCRYRVGHSPDCGRDESLPCATCHDDPGTRWCGRCGRGCNPVPAYIQRELNALRAQLAERTRERDIARTIAHDVTQARDAALARVATLRGALERAAVLCAQHVVYRDTGRLVEAMRATMETAAAALDTDDVAAQTAG